MDKTWEKVIYTGKNPKWPVNMWKMFNSLVYKCTLKSIIVFDIHLSNSKKVQKDMTINLEKTLVYRKNAFIQSNPSKKTNHAINGVRQQP